MSKTIKIKILPHWFEAVIAGYKKAELRFNDRDYQVGDTLVMREYDGGERRHTGRSVHVKVTHVADVGNLLHNYVLVSFDLLLDEH